MNPVSTQFHQSREQLDQEKILIHEAQKDRAKFGVLYKKYFEQIFMFVLKRVESEDVAADITSSVFLKALLNLPKYKDMGFPFSSWLFRIARNEVYDLFRKRKVNMVVSIEKRGLMEMISEMGETDNEDYSRLAGALSTLGDADMELVELRFFEKRPFKEVGEILDITENNAKTRTYRVLNKLKTLLSHEA